MKTLFIIIIIIFSIMVIGAISFKIAKSENKQYKNKNQNKNNQQKSSIQKYQIKNKYVSNCELEFYNTIKTIINDKYIIFPQVPLSQIVNKQPETKWHNELFRIIDFCIFSKDYNPLVCIEINDNTHHEKERYLRDKKVQAILHEAELPLITLWTDFGVKPDYIKKRLQEHLAI